MSTTASEQSPRLILSPAAVEAAPGSATEVRVSVTNPTERATGVRLSVAGIEPSWLRAPEPYEGLAPGATVVAEMAVTVPVGHPPCQIVGSVSVEDDEGIAATADLVLTVLDGSVVSAVIEPPEARGGWRALTHVVLRNRGQAPVRVDLQASSPERDLRVAFDNPTQLLEPGHEVRVRSRVRARRRLTGSPRRLPYAIRVRTSGTPVQVEGAFVQRPVLGSWITKIVALGVVVALWAAVAAVGITNLSKNVSNSAKQHAANNSPPLSTPGGPSAGTASGGGASSGGGSSAGGGGGSSSTGAGGQASTASGPAGAGSRLSGKVSATQPGGVKVTVTPTSLTSQTYQATTLSSYRTQKSHGVELLSASAPLTKLYGGALLSGPASGATPGLDALSTTTSPDGFWAFASITKPGYYLVAFSKPGYATADYVVNIPRGGKAVTLQARLVPGNGSLSGSVAGPSGPLGGVKITITDGTVSLTTRTPTVGAVGTWSVHGLTTPDTYLVTADLAGYSTQTTLVTLGAGGSQSGVDLTMSPGKGSISGTVVSATTGKPVGGLTVTASDGQVSRTTTTTTVATIGSFTLPDLTVPGTYALTVSGNGYVSQTQQVTLSSNPSKDNATVNPTVTPSGADVTGVVSSTTGGGLAGAGAILSSQTNVYKTLTTSSGTVGSFDFGQVPPGQYVLTAEDFGYTTESAQVSVGPGQTQTVNLSLPYVGQKSLATATIQGSVASLITAKPIIGAEISLDGQTASVTTDSNGQFTIAGVNPGTHTITATCPQSNPCQSMDLSTGTLVAGDFEATTVQATVSLGAVSFAPPILMPKLDMVAGVVIDGAGNPVPNPVVTLTNSQTGTVYTQQTNPTQAPATPANGGFEIDNVPHGTYQLNVTGPSWSYSGDCSPYTATNLYKPLTTSMTLQIDTDYILNGNSAPYSSPVLTLLPVYRVNTEVASGSGTPTPTQNVTVTVNGVPFTASSGFTTTCTEPATEAVVPVPTSMIYAPFTASFSYTSGGGVTYTAPQSSFQAVYNSSTVDTAILVPPVGSVNVALNFPWRTPGKIQQCPASTTATLGCPTVNTSDLPTTVSLTGTFVLAGGKTAQETVAAAPSTTGTWTFSSSSLVGLMPGQVTFNVAGGAFQPSTFSSSTTSSTFSSQTFSLTPNMTTVSGTLSSPSSGATISVSPAEAGLSVTTNSAGGIVWDESGQSTGEAFPGTYDVTFSATGYDSTVVSGFTVGLCDSACSATLGIDTSTTPTISANTFTYAWDTSATGAISLVPHVSLVVTPTNFTPYSGLPYPTVTLKDGSGNLVGSVTLSASQSSATFSDLSVTGDNYTVTVSAPAYETYTATEDFCQLSTSTGCVSGNKTLSASLTPEGYVTGTVDGLINLSSYPLSGATVKVTPTSSGSCPPSSSGAPLEATTNSNGSYTIAPVGGITVASTCTVTVTPPAGYTSTSSSSSALTIVQGTNQANLSVDATKVSQTFVVEDANGNALSGVAVSGTSAIGSPVSGTTNGTGQVTLQVDPSTYTFSFSLSQYTTLGETITYTVGEAAQSSTVKLSAALNTIQGVVSTPGTCFGASTSPCPLANATVTLSAGAGTKSTTGCTTSGSTTSASNGSYSFTDICDGNYSLSATLTGYSSGSAVTFGTGSSPTTDENLSLATSSVPVSVTVTTNLTSMAGGGSVPLSSYQVTLSPASPPTGVSATCSTSNPTLVATGNGSSETGSIVGKTSHGSTVYSSTISGVTPDFYDLDVTGTSLPTQADVGLVVCPGAGNVAEYTLSPSVTESGTSPSFEVLVGQITGAVGVSSNSAITAADLSVAISSGGTTADQPSVTCSSGGGCLTGTFASALLNIGTYTVSASYSGTGYSTSPTPSVTISASDTSAVSIGTTSDSVCSSTPTTPCLLQVSPTPDQVDITVDDGATSKPLGSGFSVTISDSSLSTSYSATTNSSGVADFASVEPDPNHAYSVTVKDPSGTALTVTTGGTVQVAIGTSPTTATVTVDTGAISGKVTASASYSGTVTVKLCTTASCSTILQSAAVTFTNGTSASSTYLFYGLTPASSGYYIEASASTGTVTGGDTTSETVTASGTTTGPTLSAS